MVAHELRVLIKQEGSKAKGHSAVGLLDALISLAYVLRASDIHLDPTKHAFTIRLRIDGLLYPEEPIPLRHHDQLIARLKVLASLRSDEHAVAQDGRFRHPVGERAEIDVRISIAPTYYGENAVLRLLVPVHELLPISGLGLPAEAEQYVLQALARTQGLVLATGPTGSGKTTTLYTFMRHVAALPISLVTIEDPIEYPLTEAIQIPAQAEAGFTIARGLRHILRQDPDVIMVGEIRDTETASLAVSASLTGHLVFSTLHTNDAPSALARLRDLRVEPYLIASTVSLVLAQRLVRKICTECRKDCRLTQSERTRLEHLNGGREVPKVIYRGTGCAACGGNGYRGRLGVYELLCVTPQVKDAILRGEHAVGLRAHAIKEGLYTLESDCLRKVAEGLTSVEEAVRVTHG